MEFAISKREFLCFLYRLYGWTYFKTKNTGKKKTEKLKLNCIRPLSELAIKLAIIIMLLAIITKYHSKTFPFWKEN